MTNYEKLRGLLAELFQFDQADLDFGIYRIMNQKRDEITRFLDRDLLPQVKQTLEEYQGGVSDAGQAELQQAVKQAQELGIDPDSSPKVQELKAKLGPVLDTAVLEDEVFSHLYDFFRRYYSDGDFISLRRYKEGVYAIPYEGEEVKLYWANHDQYYVKSSENFRDYTFKLPDERRVHFKIVDAETTKDNNRAANGNDRRFMLVEDDPVAEEDGELLVRFVYEPDPNRRRQDAINATTAETVLATPGIEGWLTGLRTPQPTDRNASRTLLDRHLDQYSKRNTFDYFIHKNLGRFLRRELDFYIKNEIMHLDDIEGETAPRVEQYLGKLRALRTVAGKLITFLAQLEDFQKKLWLKKKFVVETNYCVTLDRVPEKLYPEVLANEAQVEEWQRLFAIDEIGEGLFAGGGMNEEFLKANPYLVLDTAHFSQAFGDRLLRVWDRLDDTTDGLLVQSENLQGLSLIGRRFSTGVGCIYIDPPYNTGQDDFLYKDDYQHSSWLSLMQDRLKLGAMCMGDGGTIALSIDSNELQNLIQVMDDVYGQENQRAIVTIRRGALHGPKVINPGVVNVSENLLVYSKQKSGWRAKRIYRQRERDDRYNKYIVNRCDECTRWEFVNLLDAFAGSLGVPKSQLKRTLGDRYDAELDQFVLHNAEAVVRLARLDEDKISQAATEVKRQSEQQPERVHHFPRDGHSDWYVLNAQIVLFYSDGLVDTASGPVRGELITDIWDDVLPNDLHNEGRVTLKKGKKPEKLIGRLLEMCTTEEDVVLDFFAGSGTACAAAQKMGRKWIGIDSMVVGDEPLMNTRLKNTLNGDKSGISGATSWHGGGMFKYIRLESYEDALNNLALTRTPEQQLALDAAEPQAREEYLLSYMLDLEASGSQSLLNLDAFRNPFEYKLKVSTGIVGETKTVNVDLVETFNYLIGLRVKHIDMIRGVRVVEGTSPAGERVLILWRDVDEINNDALDEWFRRQGYNARDLEYDLIYVNGDNNLENLRRVDQTWKVRLIEADFHRLMFDVQDV